MALISPSTHVFGNISTHLIVAATKSRVEKKSGKPEMRMLKRRKSKCNVTLSLLRLSLVLPPFVLLLIGHPIQSKTHIFLFC